MDPAGGYEVAFFDLKQNKVVGSTPFGYEERLFAWRDAFDVTSRTIGSKFKTYTQPKKGQPRGRGQGRTGPVRGNLEGTGPGARRRRPMR